MLSIDLNPDRRALRTFGLIWLVAFGLIGAWIFFRHHFLFFDISEKSAPNVGAVVGGVAALGGLLAAFAPQALRPFYVALTLIALPIGFVISYLVVGLLFYGVVVPVGLVRRAFGRDPLTRKLVPGQVTYWIRRERIGDVSRYYRQY